VFRGYSDFTIRKKHGTHPIFCGVQIIKPKSIKNLFFHPKKLISDCKIKSKNFMNIFVNN